jgi:hypothetical protein
VGDESSRRRSIGAVVGGVALVLAALSLPASAGADDVTGPDILRAIRSFDPGGPALGADGQSSGPAISADGRYVALGSAASNMVGGDSNAADDVFVYDQTSSATGRVSVDSAGAQANGASS